MYLRYNRRIKNGKEHLYWSIVESQRVAGGKVIQRPVLYLGELNREQEAHWRKTIAVFDEDEQSMELFESARETTPAIADSIGVRLSGMELRRPRQWGACWLFCELWDQLKLDDFWRDRLEVNREGTDWLHVLKVLSAYRLIDPGSEWRLHRQWFTHSAMGDLLGEDFGVAEKNTLYRCTDKLLEHKNALFSHLQQRWQDLFSARFEVLLYDLTSTYFESNPPHPEGSKRAYGYSRDKRSDCVQVIIALVVTPDGLPLAYEVLPGNTSDRTTLRAFLQKIETQYGKADRIWVMDRGVPTEAVLEEMRREDPPVSYIVGTPKGRLNKLEKELLEKPWLAVREGVDVKLLPHDGEVYVLAQSRDRICKERAMRQRQMRGYIARLKAIAAMKKLTRDQLLQKLGAAKQKYPAGAKFMHVKVPGADEKIDASTFTFSINKTKLRSVRGREGRYLLRTNLKDQDPAKLWEFYIQLTQVEEAFKNLKGDLSIRPVFHQLDERIESHIFVSFLAYCLHVTLRMRTRKHAGGITPRAVLEKFKTMMMIDAWFPTVDGRWLILPRYTQPDNDHKMLLHKLGLELPQQPPPRITGAQISASEMPGSA